MYFVNTGTVRVKVNSQDVARLDDGNFFGEIALTMTSQRTADVFCEGRCELFELSRADFKQVRPCSPASALPLDSQSCRP
jgi:CRP-like cAMP-binding protein